ncbi:hypothetical protein CKO50_17075 [Pseudoalteromonas sp. HM-SA03]|uniref:phage tail tube protein n=1 Tax=unclassified Pseudoalteromonas TaxID=194690 RepID=UPI000BAE563A|nr:MULTISPECIES: hypothetical protein [unclassified Pseudoalteromonas]MCG9761076.1 hypothetical protein [Pseudoalteromonas sp. Isolate6]PAY00137.1 hypothetical protein CKO50_17075 [Pseudoalteromonas sp. HM-SA03]
MSDGYLIAGNVFVQRLNANGQPDGGVIGPINTTKLAIKTEAESKVRTSNKKADYGQALDDVRIAKPTTVSWAFDDQPAELVALALMGEVATINDASGQLTDKPVTLPADHKWVELGHKNFAEVGMDVKQGATPLTLHTDYEVNFALGLIRALPGGAVESGGAVTFTGQYNARSGKRIKGGLKSQSRLRLFGEGENLANGKQVEFDIYDVSMSPTSELDLASTEYVGAELEGTAKVKAGKDAPFVVDEISA